MSEKSPTAPAVVPISSISGEITMRSTRSGNSRLRAMTSPSRITRSKSSQTPWSGISFIRSPRPDALLCASNIFSSAGFRCVMRPFAFTATMPSERPLSMCFKRLRSMISRYMLRESW